jgi:hypothetical protein
MNDTEIQTQVGQKISDALRQLLSEKHLYQSVTVASEFLDEIAIAAHTEAAIRASEPQSGGGHTPYVRPLEEFKLSYRKFLEGEWFPSGVAPLLPTGQDILYENDDTVQKYPAPTIKVTCNHCGDRGPFNPVGALVETANELDEDQWISFSYECQNCKGEPIRFLVRRSGAKLTLSGRDPFETIELPNFIPKTHTANLRNALIANHAGQTLAGIFLMRVFIEQFWKSVPEVIEAAKGKRRPTGDELGAAYKATLPSEFRERFPTLAEVYDSLSEAMHEARADEKLFEKCHAQIIEHFDARRLFRLVLAAPSQPPVTATAEKKRRHAKRTGQ